MAKEYYFPNYPYNDLREDPFLLEKSNAYNSECTTYDIVATSDAEYQYTDCFDNTPRSGTITAGETLQICSTSLPTLTPECPPGPPCVTARRFDVYRLTVRRPSVFQGGKFVHFGYIDINGNDRSVFIDMGPFSRSSRGRVTVQVFIDTVPFVINKSPDVDYSIEKISGGGTENGDVQNNSNCYPNQLNAFDTDDSKYRHVFNSPETSFGQPFLGNVLKIENVIFGVGDAHFVPVKDNATYKLITKEVQDDALRSSEEVANIGGDFNSTAMFTAYQSYLQVYIDGITRRNYGWSYNSVASYDYYSDVENGIGIKQRMLENSQYLIPGVQSVGDLGSTITINNFQRESSVYLKTTENTTPLPYPNQSPSLVIGSQSVVEDQSRFINSQFNCAEPEEEFDISVVSYYGSIKNIFPNQWGQMYSYETIDTGAQVIFDDQALLEGTSPILHIFGGDTFISKFAFKTKLPFFIENRVNAPDDSDVFYDELGNVAYPEFWHSARSILYNYITTNDSVVLKNIISIKAHNFDCPNSQVSDAENPGFNPNRTFYDGKMYMFAYGIPNFYCESSINVDLRQAFNDREGDFYPHVSSGIPDEWVQETWVPIAQDNTYYYNVTYSKQNKENFFSHLPIDWEEKLCFTVFPFRAIYSEVQQDFTDTRVNNWLIYRPESKFDFPQNYGALTSLDGIQNKAVLARFENKSLLYNTLLTINTSNPKAAYIGNDTLFSGSPPIDFAETDLGYVGSQHKFLLKIPQGQITVDAKRGQVFLIYGNKSQDLSALGLGLTRFLTDHLPFEIIRYFPEVPIDNHFNGIGLHGVYDSKYDRVIISKLDYSPLSDDIQYDANLNEFYIDRSFAQQTTTTTSSTTITEASTLPSLVIRERVYLTDPTYFCNKSWTLSYNMNTQTWISFHSYIPNWYIAENNFFYSGLNGGCDLEIIAVEFVPPTTTSTTSQFIFACELEGTVDTTSSTTTIIPDCELEGNAEPSDITTTTTTTGTPTTTTTTTEDQSLFVLYDDDGPVFYDDGENVLYDET